MAHIVHIVITPKDALKASGAFIRVPIEQGSLVPNKGIQGDRKGKHPTRQLNVMDTDGVAWLAAQGFAVAPGQLGEQIVVSGIDMSALNVGDRVQVGDAIIEVTEFRNGCAKFADYQGAPPPPKGAKRMGIIARVIAGGEITIGTLVSAIPSEETASAAIP